MNKINSLRITFIAIIFGLMIVFPYAVQFSHLFEAHEHKVCTDSKVHLHEDKLECQIHDFQFSEITFEIESLSVQPNILHVTLESELRTSNLSSKNNSTVQLRGPPSNS